MPPIKPKLSIRAATCADADILSKIEVLARPTDPSWTYRYPHRDEFPEDHARFNRIKYDALLAPGSKFTVMLAESPSLEDPEKVIPIALSIWDLNTLPGYQVPEPPVSSASTPVASSQRQRRDENPAHISAFLSTHSRAKQFFFDDSFAPQPEGYIYCMVLATHPDYQGRGAATSLCRWGMERARDVGSKMCIRSSQEDRSRRLYDKKLGFVNLGAFVVRVGREEETFRGEALGWDSRW